MIDDISIRSANPEDAKELLKIYAYYVTDTAISFETEVPSEEEFKLRIEEVLKSYPFIVACKDDEILGYAYLHSFVGRKAYELSAETTIYLNPDKKKMGIGKKLYSVLEDIAKAQNITNLYSCIGYVDKEDEYLNNNSVQFHEHIGFRMVGKFENCGHKFGRWYHMVWMEKIIGKHGEIKEFLKFEETDYML
ncbi:GNAT family N-acetyltransferase [Lachnoanaerobaculum gingivalis]|uniref:GNAT family N-acetyltransferase n=1 Tax=Lachnoanaerobaculum gingivalis TaxID=2490855 RepID=UPI0024A71595|nr:GNAT family N-acetyltransferase [Lachnoanaerobaculum gingivalis]WHE86119.1 N-acetyltransferase family protein [Lachnoanaerobaculum gingivalis]